MVVLLGTVAVAGVGGAILGGQLLASAPAGPADGAGEEEGEKPQDDGPVVGTYPFAPIIVDFTHEGEIRHLKIGVSVELVHDDGEGNEELEKYTPRGREAIISYARSLTFVEATDPKEFERVRKELSEHVINAMGKERVSRVVITDYVAQ
jgi:flagellar basal body-associated protein FliL